jgi:phospholipid/cholesterol/gamma-HCH transport system substrate-binding protein/paraquat-inducible protein B
MRRPNYFKIGLFVLSAAAILVGAVIAFGIGALFEEEVMVETYFESSVQGLDIGSPVKFRGVQIGNVKEMTLVRREYETRHRYVLVRMALNRETFLTDGEKITRAEMQREVAQGLRVRLGFQGVTGAAYIEVDYLDPERYPPLPIDWKPDYPYIPASPSIITRITDAIDGILRNLEKINVEGLAGSLETTLGALNRALERTDVQAIGTQAEQLLKELRETNRHLDAKLQALRLEPLLARADATLEEIRQLAAETKAPLEEFLRNSASASQNLNALLAKLNGSDDLPASLAHLRQTLTRLDRLLASQQDEVETTLENLQQMSENFRALSEEAKENPAGILFGAPPPRRSPGGER